jgi:L-amino acid N-acyltransferase YncA
MISSRQGAAQQSTAGEAMARAEEATATTGDARDGTSWWVSLGKPVDARAGEPEPAPVLLVRDATAQDWPQIWSFWRPIVAAGDTFTYDEATGEDEARSSWMVDPPGRVAVAAAPDGAIAGSASMYANRGGPGAHIASASYLVDPSHQGTGVGRRLVTDSLRWAREQQFVGMQFNAVAETNERAVQLYESLGFTIVGTVPGAFRHPSKGAVGLHVMFCPL